jgi:hypothetical protein
MSTFIIRYPRIKQLLFPSVRDYEYKGPNDPNEYKNYWLYHIIKDLDKDEPEIILEESRNNEIKRVYDENIIIFYELVNTQDTYSYINFYGIQDNNNKNRKIVINSFNDNNQKNYDNYKDLFNEIIRIVSLINEKEENKNNKIRLFIDRSAIQNYTEDKKKWKTPSKLGQFTPTFFSKIGFNNQLEWIPNKNINISDFNSKKISDAIGQKLVNDGTKAGTKKNIDTAAVNNIMTFLGDTNIKHFTKGGKRKTKNQKKSRKSKKRNQTNKNH